jgi:hypothetical protein
MNVKLVMVVMAAVLSFSVSAYAAEKDSRDIVKEGFLGAGAGSVGALASGAKGKDVWKGALAGTAINTVGGALVDSLSGERVTSVNRVAQLPPQDAYSQGYQAGYSNGYQSGYVNGLRDGVRDSSGGYRPTGYDFPGPGQSR